MGSIFPCLPAARIKRHFVSQLVIRFTQSPLPRQPIRIWIVDPDTQAIPNSGGNIISLGSFSGEDSSTREVTMKVQGLDSARSGTRWDPSWNG